MCDTKNAKTMNSSTNVEARKVRFCGKIYDARVILPAAPTSTDNDDMIHIQLPCGIIVPEKFTVSRSRDVLQEYRNNIVVTAQTLQEEISPKWLRSVLMLPSSYNKKENNSNKTSVPFSEINKLHVISATEPTIQQQQQQQQQQQHFIVQCYSVREQNELGRPCLILFGKYSSPSTSISTNPSLARESKAYEILIHLGLNAKNIIAPICYFANGENQVLAPHTSSSFLLLQQLPISYSRFPNPKTARRSSHDSHHDDDDDADDDVSGIVTIDTKTGETLRMLPDVRPDIARVALSLAALHESMFTRDEDALRTEQTSKTTQTTKHSLAEQSLCPDAIFFEKWNRSLQPWGREYLENYLARKKQGNADNNDNDDFKAKIAQDILLCSPSPPKVATTTFLHGSLYDHRHVLLDRHTPRSPAVFVDWKHCGLGYREIDLLHFCAGSLHPMARKQKGLVGDSGGLVDLFVAEYVKNCIMFRAETTSKNEQVEKTMLMERMKFICKILTMTKPRIIKGEEEEAECDWIPNEEIRFELLRLLNDEWDAIELE